MRVSLLSVLDHYPALPRTVGGLYQELLDQIILADELGYEVAFVAEHHFRDFGVAPNPAVFLAAAAQSTRSIRLGPAASMLPLHDPRTLAEDYVMLDLLSRGRLVLGLGVEPAAHELAGHGVDMAAERFEESLPLAKRLMAGEHVSHRGHFFQLDKVHLGIRSLQHDVPVYVCAPLRASALKLGRLGQGLLTLPDLDPDFPHVIRRVADDLQSGRAEVRARSLPRGLPVHLVAVFVHVAGSDTEAEMNVRLPFERYCRLHGEQRFLRHDLAWGAGPVLFGSVETVAEKLLGLEQAGVGAIATLHNFGAMPHEAVRRSMRLFVEGVIPRARARLGSAQAA